jgi:hypothetical protein
MRRMTIELQLHDPSVGSNLLDFFHRNGLRAVLDGERVLVESRHHQPERQIAEVALLVRIWQIVNPEYVIEIQPSGGSD